MTDIYIGQNRDRKGCRGIIIAALIVIVLVIIWAAHRAYVSRKATADDGATDIVSTDNSTTPSASQPEAAPKVQEEKPTKKAPKSNKSTEITISDNSILLEAQSAASQDNLLTARNLALQILKGTNSPSIIAAAEELLGEVNIKLVMTPRRMPGKEDYTVKSGDTLGGLAKRFGSTVDLIRKSNNVSGSLIRAGDRYRILRGTFTITASKSANEMIVKLDDLFFKRYPVGTGKYEKTPTGDFKITERIAQPTWWRPDGKPVPFGHKENVLGTHWLSLNVRGYGIHGTWEPDTIGKQLSAGCIRLLNKDIEELYTLVPVGTKVTITE